MNLEKTIDIEKHRAREEERENNTEQYKFIEDLRDQLEKKEVENSNFFS